MDLQKMLTPAEVAKLIGLDVGTLANWRCTGSENLPYVKFGNRVRYHPAELADWLESKRADTPAVA